MSNANNIAISAVMSYITIADKRNGIFLIKNEEDIL
jgi:hypothetical protein